MPSLTDFADMMEDNSKLHEAVLEGDLELTTTLLHSKSCDVNEADNSGRTALHFASLRGKTDFVSLLLSKGANPEASDNQGNTPLHWCGHTEAIELLVEYGADVLRCNKRGFTPRDLAERKGVSESVCNLLQQLEFEVQEHKGQFQCSEAVPVSHTKISRKPVYMKLRSSSQQAISGLWQELASELGGRSFMLLILGLLGFSLYIAYILTGLHHGSQARIPIDGTGDNIMVQI